MNRSEVAFPILAVDYGLKRVGLAVCDENGRVAVGVGILTGVQGRALTRAVYAAARERGAKSILIGSPHPELHGSKPVIEGADLLSEKLRLKGLNVYRLDESGTTAEALDARRTAGGRGRKTTLWIDEAAAIILLRRFLDSLSLESHSEAESI